MTSRFEVEGAVLQEEKVFWVPRGRQARLLESRLFSSKALPRVGSPAPVACSVQLSPAFVCPPASVAFDLASGGLALSPVSALHISAWRRLTERNLWCWQSSQPASCWMLSCPSPYHTKGSTMFLQRWLLQLFVAAVPGAAPQSFCAPSPSTQRSSTLQEPFLLTQQVRLALC